MCRLLISQEFSDLKIQCGKYSFSVHKPIVCAQSEYFRVACRKGTFKVTCVIELLVITPNSWQEGESGIFELKATDSDGAGGDDGCDDPECVMLMVHFFYHQDYTTEAVTLAAEEPPSDNANMVMHAKVFATAVKYQVPALASLAAKKFEQSAKLNYEHADFARAIKAVYTSTPEDEIELRTVVVGILGQHKELMKKPEIRSIVKSINGLAFDLLAKTWKAYDVKPAAAVIGIPAQDACKYCGDRTDSSAVRCCACCSRRWGVCAGCIFFGSERARCLYCCNGVSPQSVRR